MLIVVAIHSWFANNANESPVNVVCAHLHLIVLCELVHNNANARSIFFQGTASIHGIIKVGGGITLSFSLSDLVNFYHLL